MRRVSLTESADGAPAPAAIVIEPDAADDPATQLRRAFAAAAQGSVVIDLRRVTAVSPDFMRVLSERLDGGGEVILSGVAPEVYKALHVAGLAARLRRASADGGSSRHP
jgi:anti-anti-sigma regulatory factor